MAKSLFDKTYIGKMKLKNRIFMSPMGTTGEADGAYCNEGIDYFEERAKGGAGLIITGANVVSTKYEPRPCTELSDFHHVERLNMLIERCHAYGAKVCVQLSPGLGRQQFTDPFTPPYSAGSVGAFWFPNLICKPFSKEDIHYLVEKVGYSASLAVNAGADCVELHAYGGYLLDQFHSVQWNNRTDEYGGSAENRARFPKNIIRKVREATGPDFIVGYRLSASEGVEGGLTPEDTAAFAKSIENDVDYINVAAGIYETMEQYIIPPNYEPHAMVVPFAKVIKEQVTKCPVIVVNSLTPETAEKALEDQCADIIAMGRPLIADPELPKKLIEGRREDIRPCCRGHEGCVSLFFSGCPIRCEVNPQCGREKELKLVKTNNPQNIVIIGGGVAGMEAARYGCEVGHNITLIEKTNELGGHFIEATMPSFKEDHKSVLDWLKTQVKKSGAKVMMNTEATPELIKELNPDAIIIATGSHYTSIPVPGIEKAITPDVAIKRTVPIGDKVVVIGGGLVGSEVALDLGNEGKDVTIIEMLPAIASQDEPLSQISLIKCSMFNFL